MSTTPESDLTVQESIAVGAVPSNRASRRVLEPAERIAEVLFGLIMVLTFTGSLSVAEAYGSPENGDVRAMLIGALGCNLAWGVIDGLFYLMGCLAEKGRNLATYKALLAATTPEEGRGLLADALPPVIAALLKPTELESIRERALELPEPPRHVRLDFRDWWGAFGVFLLVFVSTLPVTVPFMVLQRLGWAMRLSNLIAVAMLFVIGFAFARLTGRHPWLLGALMVLLGGALVSITMALGG